MSDPYAELPAPSKKRQVNEDMEDPYADLPSASKRQNVVSSDGQVEAAPKPEEVVETPEEKQSKQPLDVLETIDKLRSYMLVDKKFSKASKLFATLMEEQCQAEKPSGKNLTRIMQVLQELIETKRDRVHHASAREDFAKLFRLVNKHRDILLRGSEFESDDVDNWYLDAVLHNELFTDDTFLFAKTAKQIATQITTRRDEAVEMDNLNDVAAFDGVLLPCLKTLMSRHSVSWAKTSVEMVLALCTARRLTFSDSARPDIDEWTSIIHQRKAAPSTKLSAAAEMRKNIVAYNDTQTGIKVGKSNHPLYNKD